MVRVLKNILLVGLMVCSGAVMRPAEAPASMRALLAHAGIIVIDGQRAALADELIRAHGGDVQEAFFDAVLRGDIGIFELLIARGARIDAVSSNGLTVLCKVVSDFLLMDNRECRVFMTVGGRMHFDYNYDYEGIFHFLLSAGADIEKLYTIKLRGSDNTVLDVAINNNSCRFVRRLIAELRKKLERKYPTREYVPLLSIEELADSLGILSTLNQDVIGQCTGDLSGKDLASLACVSRGCKQLVYGIMNETFPRCKREELNAVIDLALQRAGAENMQEIVTLLEQEKYLGFDDCSDLLTAMRRRMICAAQTTLSLVTGSDSKLLIRKQLSIRQGVKIALAVGYFFAGVKLLAMAQVLEDGGQI